MIRKSPLNVSVIKYSYFSKDTQMVISRTSENIVACYNVPL